MHVGLYTFLNIYIYVGDNFDLLFVAIKFVSIYVFMWTTRNLYYMIYYIPKMKGKAIEPVNEKRKTRKKREKTDKINKSEKENKKGR